MDRLHRDLQRTVPDNVSIVLGHSTDTRTFPRDTVCLVPSVFESCPDMFELSEAFRKRFRGMKVPYSIDQLVTIGVSCVCSADYTVNHHTIRFLQPSNILKVWEHIETLCVSSSPELSAWMVKSVNRRSQRGYNLLFRDDEGVPSFKPEVRGVPIRIQSHKNVTMLNYHDLPMAYDSAVTVGRAAANDSILLSVSRVCRGMEPLYSITSPNLPSV